MNTQTHQATHTPVSEIAELMIGWNVIESTAKRQFPHASAEELYLICKSAMNSALRIA